MRNELKQQIIEFIKKCVQLIYLILVGGRPPEFSTASLESIDESARKNLIKILENIHFARRIASTLFAEYQLLGIRYYLLAMPVTHEEDGIEFIQLTKNLAGLQLQWRCSKSAGKQLKIKDTIYAYDIAIIEGYRDSGKDIRLKEIQDENVPFM